MSDLDRAWPRRALVGPYPWGKTLSGVWLDDTVSFYRTDLVPDGKGGFSSTLPESAYWTTEAHVRLVEQQSGSSASESDNYSRVRSLDIRVQYPSMQSMVPKRGDHVTYVLHTGETLRLFIKDVTDPRGFADHLHVFATEQS